MAGNGKGRGSEYVFWIPADQGNVKKPKLDLGAITSSVVKVCYNLKRFPDLETAQEKKGGGGE